MTDASEPLPAASGVPVCVDWERGLAVHEHWLRKVIGASTGEEQAVDVF